MAEKPVITPTILASVGLAENQETVETEDKKIEPVITSGAVMKKKGLGRRILDVFFTGDMKSVKDYIVKDVVIPAVKETISEVVNKGTNALLFPGQQRYTSSYTNYGGTYKIFSPSAATYTPAGAVTPNATVATASGFDDITIQGPEAETKAMRVIDELLKLQSRYPCVTVQDLKALANIPYESTDSAWGWESCLTPQNVYPVRMRRDVYIIHVPRPTSLR